MGAAGDMLTASLLELIEDKEKMLEKFNTLGLPDVKVEAAPTIKCGICGTFIKVSIHGTEEGELLDSDQHEHIQDHHQAIHHHHPAPHHTSHTHAKLADIESIIQHLYIPKEVQDNAIKIYHILAEAEGRVHGNTKDAVHFPVSYTHLTLPTILRV